MINSSTPSRPGDRTSPSRRPARAGGGALAAALRRPAAAAILGWTLVTGAAVSGTVGAQTVAASPAARPAEAAASAVATAPTLRIVGGLAALNQFTRHEEPFWTRELARLTNGRHRAEIVPFDRAGLRAQDLLPLVRMGSVPFGTVLLSVSAAQEPELAAPDLPGLNPDIASLRRSVAAFRPTLQALLRERHGVELLALYTHPAQVLFCKDGWKTLDDLKGRRVRTSSRPMSDWVEALGGQPVPTGFTEILPNFRAGNIDCAITGTMSGNTIGLFEHAQHVHGMAVSWGLTAFVAHGAAWRGLPEELRRLLLNELPKLERAIWDDSDRETAEGIACNVGAAACASGRRARMSEVPLRAADLARSREIFAGTVLPRWLQRCGAGCESVWQRTLAPVAAAGSAPLGAQARAAPTAERPLR